MDPCFADKDINRKRETNSCYEKGDQNRIGSVDASIHHGDQRIDEHDNRTSTTSGAIESTTAGSETQVSATQEQQEKNCKKQERQHNEPIKVEDNQNIFPPEKVTSKNDGKDDEPTTRNATMKNNFSDRPVARSGTDETSIQNSLPILRGEDIMGKGSHSDIKYKVLEDSDRSNIMKGSDFTSMNANHHQGKNEGDIRAEVCRKLRIYYFACNKKPFKTNESSYLVSSNVSPDDKRKS